MSVGASVGFSGVGELPLAERRSVEAKGERWFALGLTIAYAALVLLGAMHHEAWRDEADPWLAARDMSFGELFRWLGASGSPGLWYWLLIPLAKGGLPFQSMGLLHAALAIVAAGLVAFRAPFPRAVRVLLLFSFYLFYQYAVVARSYVLTVLLVFLIAIVLTANRRRPIALGILLFLLANTNVHGLIIASVLGVAVGVEWTIRHELGWDAVAGGAIALAGGALAVMQLALAPAHSQVAYTEPHWGILGDAISQAFFPQVPAYFGAFQRWAHGREVLAWIGYLGIRVAGAAILVGVLIAMRKRLVAMSIVAACWVGLIYVFVFKWYGGERHAGLLFLVTVFGMWLSRGSASEVSEEPARKSRAPMKWLRVAVASSLCVSAAAAALWSWRDLRREYSGSKTAAAFLRPFVEAGMPIAANPTPQCECVLAYLPRSRFWYVGREQWGSFVRWDQDWTADYRLKDTQIIERVKSRFGGTPHLLLMASKPLARPAESGYRLEFQSPRQPFDENAADEVYFVYEPLIQPPAK